MSELTSFFTPDLSMLCAISQEQVLRKFLPIELIPDGWSCQKRSLIENIRSLYVDCNKRIQMYGSPKSLEESLANFMTFPGNEQFFKFSDSVRYKTYLPVYQSLGSISYIYKKDFYELLFEYAPKIDLMAPLLKLGQSLVTYYLRIQKNKLETLHEMTSVNGEFIEELVDKKLLFEKVVKTGEWKKHMMAFPLDPKNNGEILNAITELFERCEVETKFGSDVQEIITTVIKDVPVHNNGFHYKKMLTWLYITIMNFTSLINKNKMIMFSRSETVDSIPASKIPIRLFECDQERIVMSHELLHAIKLEKLDVSGFEGKILAMPKLSAMSFREVFAMVPSSIFKKLEFVRIPMRTGSKDVNMIPTVDGSYCLTSYQFLILTLSDVVLVKRVFQGMKCDQWIPFMREFYTMLAYILNNESYFVSYEKYEQTKLFLGNWFGRHFSSLNRNEISNVNKNGFTFEDIRDQLERLELCEIFPQIGETAYQIRSTPTNGCAYEATRQMFQRIQDWQFAFVLNSLPNQLSDFFHERKWCVKLQWKRCPLCSEKRNEKATVKKTEASYVSVESKKVEEEENLIETIASSSDASSSDESSESFSTERPDDLVVDNHSPSATLEMVVVKEEKPVQKQKKTKKKHTEKPAVKPEIKESQSCPKCIRASEYTVKTNEKLRLSKIEVKHLKKELSEVQLALEKKEERIRILEEKLREKEHQLSLKNSEVGSLNIKKQELQKKNERNERLIASFHEVNSKKDVAIKSWQYHSYEKDKLIKELKSKESKAILPRPTEESEKVHSLLSNLMETKSILSKEDPIRKSSEICDALITNTNSKVTQQLVKYETKLFQLQVSSYTQIVENNIKLIRGNQAVKLDQILDIPDFPEFSEEFKNVHKSIMKKEAPLLCRQLLNLTDEIADMECVICISEMESHDGTTKCGHCKRRYHNDCIKSWLKTKSICPTCKERMIDEQEFPAL